MDIQKEVVKTARTLGEERNEPSMRFSFWDLNGNELVADEIPGSVSILKTTSKAKVNALLKQETTENFTSNLCCIVCCYLSCTLCCGCDFPVKGPVVTELPDGSTVIFVVSGATIADDDIEVATEALQKHNLPVRNSL